MCDRQAGPSAWNKTGDIINTLSSPGPASTISRAAAVIQQRSQQKITLENNENENYKSIQKSKKN